MADAERLTLPTGGAVPNSPLPVRLYRGAFAGQSAADIERHLAARGWTGAWRDGIYPFHHFHSTAHEVLVVAAGDVHVRLGGEAGASRTLRAGDALVLPAGTGHRNMGGGADLLVIGAYAGGREWDLCKPGETDPQAALKHIADVPAPRRDPVMGALWEG